MNGNYKSFPTNNRKECFLYNRRKTSKNAQYPKPKTERNVCPIPLKTYNSKVKLFPSRCQLRKTGRTMAKISKYHILESKNTGRDICRNILDTDIGLSEHYKNINLDSVIPALSSILELFKIRHNRFNYSDKLKYIIENGKKNATQKYKNQINVCLLQSFFSLLLYKNVPFELFGTLRNQKAIKKTIYHLLKTIPGKVLIESTFKRTIRRTKNITGALLDIQPLFEKLDISNIRWLNSTNNSIVQCIIMLKLVHWFFAQYIIKILHKYVVLNVIKKKWVYITKDNWCNMQEEFIKEKKKSLSLIPFTQLNKRYIGMYKFILGSSGLRALFIVKYNAKEKYDDIDVVLRFLQQLYVTYFNENGISTVTSCKKEILNFVNSRSKNRLYFVCCDIQDAFGSIIQQKLYDIIIKYCEQLEKYLAIQVFTLTKSKKSQTKKFTVQILSCNLKKQIPKNAIPSREKPKLVQTQKLINKIYKLIFQLKVKLNDHLYSMKIGVPQGPSVSPILSDIYYQHMLKETISEYTNNSLLCRYVDDIIYITENEHYAAKFLEIVKNGIPEYNIKFNSKKIRSNVGMPYIGRSMEIRFLKQISNISSCE